MENLQNPYAPPQSELNTETEHIVIIAGKGRRFGTFIVDSIVCTVLKVFAFSIIGAAMAWLFSSSTILLTLQRAPLIVSLLLEFFGAFIYYVFFEYVWARTPGKLVFGTIVISESGKKLGLGQVVARTLCRFIPFDAFSFFGKAGWHDSISGTQVILANPSPQNTPSN